MATKNKIVVKTVAAHDQDCEGAMNWLMNNPIESQKLVVDCINKRYKDPAMELMSQFAQIGMTEMLLRIEERKKSQ